MGSGLSRDLSWWGVVPDRDSSCGSSGIVVVGSGPRSCSGRSLA